MEYREGQRISPAEIHPHLSAWIDPQGRVYHVPECAHDRVAREYLKATGSSELEAKGWMHLTYGNVYLERDATQGQIDTLWIIKMEALDRASDWYRSAFLKTIQRFIGI